jgi:type II secretory pathway component PulF
MDLTEFIEGHWNKVTEDISKAQFSKAKQIDFLKDLVDSLPYVGTPMPILQALEKHADGSRMVIAQQMINHLNAGHPLSDAMAGWFDPILINATRVGEEHGVLVESLEPVLKTFEKNSSSVKEALKSFVYPSVLTVFAVFLIINLKNELFPSLLQLVNNDVARFPLPLKALWNLGNWITDYGVIALTAFGLGFWLFSRLLKSDFGAFSEWRYEWPLFKHYAYVKGAGFMQMYATLKRINVIEMDIVYMAMEDATPFYYAHLERFQQGLNEGLDNMADIFDTGLLAPEMVDRLRLLSGSERFVDALEVASAKISSTTQAQINLAAKVIAGLWMLGIGIIIMITFSGMFAISQLQAA